MGYPEVNRSLQEMSDRVYEVNVANGWYDANRTIGDDIALLHSEVSEAFEAYRTNGLTDMTQQIECVICGSVQHTGVFHKPLGDHDFTPAAPKPEGWGSELADIFIRLLDTARRTHVDLEAEYERKLDFNKTRGYRHGNKNI